MQPLTLWKWRARNNFHTLHGPELPANSERTARIFFQATTIFSLAVFALVMLVGFPWEDTLPGAMWVEFGRRSVVSLAFAAIAAFASREASKHGERERRYRLAELDIASLEPFLASLDPVELNMIKKEFAERVFGRDASPIEVENTAATTNGLVQTLDMVVRELLKLVRNR